MGKILVVDDENEIADLLEFYLSNEGYEVVIVNTGEVAIHIVEENSNDIDLALLDIMLPDIDWFYLF